LVFCTKKNLATLVATREKKDSLLIGSFVIKVATSEIRY
jgi:hypothetical protein